MLDKHTILAPAKLNIFLKIFGKRKDGYHEIKSGITFINLYDKIEIQEYYKTSISYSGKFKPLKGNYDDCIIKKTLNFLGVKKNLGFKINVTKNIPVQGGLGSASTDAAALIIALEKMKLIEHRDPNYYSSLGADIPCFLFNKNCLAEGRGERLSVLFFPKYFFLLTKPHINNSTKQMYDKLKFELNSYKQKSYNKFEINNNQGNDFEKIFIKENSEFREIINFMKNLDGAIFSRMTGSGSCCYSAFEEKDHAINASKIFKLKFPNLWFKNCENNIEN